MPQNMSISVNGQSQVPPGFRFHPTEEELLQYYLRKKVSFEKIDLDVIRDVDLNKLEPWDIQEKCKIGSTQNDWYFFSHKDKKYPSGTRTNRATAAGFWKATGRDKVIHTNSRRIGMRKTLVFYIGRAPHGQKSDWIMHEYRLDDTIIDSSNVSYAMGEATQEEGWVVCRIFKKKNQHKTLDSPMSCSSSMISADHTRTSERLMMSPSDEGTLEQILYMGRTCKEEDDDDDHQENNNSSRRFLIDTRVNNGGFMKLPSLESPNSISSQQQIHAQMFTADNINEAVSADPNSIYHSETGLNDWAAFDQLVASHLNIAQTETILSKQQASSFSDPTMAFCSPTTTTTTSHHDLQILQQLRSSSNNRNRSQSLDHATQDYNNEFGLWSFARSSFSPAAGQLCHMPNAPHHV